MNVKEKIDCISVGELETNCWLYSLEDGAGGPCIVIDPGDEASLIISCLKKINRVPRYIFLTHGHFDHVAALPGLLKAFEEGVFGEAPVPKVGIHRLDAHYLGKDALSVHRNSFSAVGGSPAYIDALWKPLPEADILFEEGDNAGPFRILHIPGHTQGSVGFYDEKAGVLFSGDTLFKRNWGRTDLPGGSEGLIRKSLKRLLSLEGKTLVCSGHGPVTTIKDELQNPEMAY